AGSKDKPDNLFYLDYPAGPTTVLRSVRILRLVAQEVLRDVLAFPEILLQAVGISSSFSPVRLPVFAIQQPCPGCSRRHHFSQKDPARCYRVLQLSGTELSKPVSNLLRGGPRGNFQCCKQFLCEVMVFLH